MGTHKIEDGMLVCSTKGSFAHRDLSAEYEENGKYHGLEYGTFLSFFSFLVFLGPHLQHMEVPRLRVELELQLLAYTTATATPDPRCL